MYKKINFFKKFFFTALLCLLCPLLLYLCTACKQSVDYMDYVSELRSNIFLASTENFSLRIYAVTKEYPYASDGVPQETSTRLEAYLVAPQGIEACTISIHFEKETYHGEMSFDNVKTEYYFSYSADVATAKELPCEISYGQEKVTLVARSVKTDDILSAKTLLGHLQNAETELFQSLTDKYGFAGELYIRFIYEGAPYYYVGVIDRNGCIHAFLLDAKTGKVLAKRTT